MSLFRKIKDAITRESTSAQLLWPDEKHGWANDFPEQATVKDIYFCFRLILGRNPNKEEWPGHSNRAGEPLRDIVQTYLHSQEFNDRNLMQRRVPKNIKLAEYENFKIYAAEDDIAVGKYVLAKNYESNVAGAFRHVLKPGMGVVDIGANIGYFSLLSASIVGDQGWVMAVEPNSENTRFIGASRRINRFDHLRIIQAAASVDEDIMVLRNEYSNGTCTFLPEDKADLFASETIGCLRVDKLVDKKVDLIKIDVEGAELLAAQGCINVIDAYSPMVIFEFSPPRIVDINGRVSWREFLSIFFDRDYTLSVIESGGQFNPCRNPDEAYHAFEESGVDHIDLIACKN